MAGHTQEPFSQLSRDELRILLPQALDKFSFHLLSLAIFYLPAPLECHSVEDNSKKDIPITPLFIETLAQWQEQSPLRNL
jgi:hypothetical protein